jgi:hypothetical protein
MFGFVTKFSFVFLEWTKKQKFRSYKDRRFDIFIPVEFFLYFVILRRKNWALPAEPQEDCEEKRGGGQRTGTQENTQVSH